MRTEPDENPVFSAPCSFADMLYSAKPWHYLLTFKVSRYCLLALSGRVVYAFMICCGCYGCYFSCFADGEAAVASAADADGDAVVASAADADGDAVVASAADADGDAVVAEAATISILYLDIFSSLSITFYFWLMLAMLSQTAPKHLKQILTTRRTTNIRSGFNPDIFLYKPWRPKGFPNLKSS